MTSIRTQIIEIIIIRNCYSSLHPQDGSEE